MGWKSLFVFLLLLIAGIAYYLWNVLKEAPQDATPTGYTNALKNDLTKAQNVAGAANLDTVKSAVEKYRSDKGSLPSSLQDLVPNYLDHVPGGLQYDSSTGTVSVAQ